MKQMHINLTSHGEESFQISTPSKPNLSNSRVAVYFSKTEAEVIAEMLLMAPYRGPEGETALLKVIDILRD